MCRQLTLKALAEKVRLTSRMVSEYEKKYCTSIPPEETVAAFEKALALDGISIRDVAEQLALPLEEVTNLIFKIGLINTDPDKINISRPRKPKLELIM